MLEFNERFPEQSRGRMWCVCKRPGHILKVAGEGTSLTLSYLASQNPIFQHLGAWGEGVAKFSGC